VECYRCQGERRNGRCPHRGHAGFIAPELSLEIKSPGIDARAPIAQSGGCSQEIRGDPGTSVKITVMRPSTGETKDYDLTLRYIKVETSRTLTAAGFPNQ